MAPGLRSEGVYSKVPGKEQQENPLFTATRRIWQAVPGGMGCRYSLPAAGWVHSVLRSRRELGSGLPSCRLLLSVALKQVICTLRLMVTLWGEGQRGEQRVGQLSNSHR